jgi:hypothetical protein
MNNKIKIKRIMNKNDILYVLFLLVNGMWMEWKILIIILIIILI